MIRKTAIVASSVLSFAALGLYIVSYLPCSSSGFREKGFSFGRMFFMAPQQQRERVPWPRESRMLGFVYRGGATCSLNKMFVRTDTVFRCDIPFLLRCCYRRQTGLLPQSYTYPLITDLWEISVRLWWMILLFAIYPTIAFIRGPYRRYRRRKKGLCLKCGYNLTGNVSGVCPECGEQI